MQLSTLLARLPLSLAAGLTCPGSQVEHGPGLGIGWLAAWMRMRRFGGRAGRRRDKQPMLLGGNWKHFGETGLLHGSEFRWALVRTLLLLPARQNRYLVPDGSQDKQLSGLRTRFAGYGAPESAGWRRHQTVQSAQNPCIGELSNQSPANQASPTK